MKVQYKINGEYITKENIAELTHLLHGDLMRIIPQLCKNAREHASVTQSEMAREVLTTQQNISNFEKGKNNNLYIFLYYYLRFNSYIIKYLNENYNQAIIEVD